MISYFLYWFPDSIPFELLRSLAAVVCAAGLAFIVDLSSYSNSGRHLGNVTFKKHRSETGRVQMWCLAGPQQGYVLQRLSFSKCLLVVEICPIRQDSTNLGLSFSLAIADRCLVALGK
jgi:hypothetical protein